MANWPLVIIGGPWPERIGKRCREVQPSHDLPAGVYPFDKPRGSEVVVLIEDDPLGWDGNRWSCSISRSHLGASYV